LLIQTATVIKIQLPHHSDDRSSEFYYAVQLQRYIGGYVTRALCSVCYRENKNRTGWPGSAFTVAEPAVRNAIPPELRNATYRTTFIRQLKTLFYNKRIKFTL